MKNAILLALGAAFFIIGVHQSFLYGVGASYWLFMLSGICVLILQLGKKKENKVEKTTEPTPKKKASKRKKKR